MIQSSVLFVDVLNELVNNSYFQSLVKTYRYKFFNFVSVNVSLSPLGSQHEVEPVCRVVNDIEGVIEPKYEDGQEYQTFDVSDFKLSTGCDIIQDGVLPVMKLHQMEFGFKMIEGEVRDSGVIKQGDGLTLSSNAYIEQVDNNQGVKFVVNGDVSHNASVDQIQMRTKVPSYNFKLNKFMLQENRRVFNMVCSIGQFRQEYLYRRDSIPEGGCQVYELFRGSQEFTPQMLYDVGCQLNRESTVFNEYVCPYLECEFELYENRSSFLISDISDNEESQNKGIRIIEADQAFYNIPIVCVQQFDFFQDVKRMVGASTSYLYWMTMNIEVELITQ